MHLLYVKVMVDSFRAYVVPGQVCSSWSTQNQKMEIQIENIPICIMITQQEIFQNASVTKSVGCVDGPVFIQSDVHELLIVFLHSPSHESSNLGSTPSMLMIQSWDATFVKKGRHMYTSL